MLKRFSAFNVARRSPPLSKNVARRFSPLSKNVLRRFSPLSKTHFQDTVGDQRFATVMSRLAAVIVWIVLVPQLAYPADPGYSELWGVNGEDWTAEGRLPDFSFAGYQRGEKPLPTLHADCSVKDFGAIGDGKTDDTRAFQEAIRRSPGKVIYIPEGVYVITDFLIIDTAGTSLLGAGSHASLLKFPKPLNEIKPNWGATTGGQRTSNYSWSGGFITIRGTASREPIAQVTADASRGAHTLHIADIQRLQVGQNIRLQMRDTSEQSLAGYLYAGDPGPIDNLGSRVATAFSARISRLDIENKRIEIDRPLRTDVRSAWEPRIYSDHSSVEEVGIENLGFEFPVLPYEGHFTELGFNALVMSGVRNCWARNLWIHNADSGIFLSGTNITLRAIEFQSERPTERSRQATGHHGITLGGQDNLLTDFDFRTRFMHDITVTRGSAGNVAANGKGLDLCFDHHRYGPHANLFTNIDLGAGTRMFQSGGGAALGRHSAAWETFWNIRARQAQTWPEGWGPDLMNLVGVESRGPATIDQQRRWFETFADDRLEPKNLYNAQLGKRLQRNK